jgi:hypothetical protein
MFSVSRPVIGGASLVSVPRGRSTTSLAGPTVGGGGQVVTTTRLLGSVRMSVTTVPRVGAAGRGAPAAITGDPGSCTR